MKKLDESNQVPKLNEFQVRDRIMKRIPICKKELPSMYYMHKTLGIPIMKRNHLAKIGLKMPKYYFKSGYLEKKEIRKRILAKYQKKERKRREDFEKKIQRDIKKKEREKRLAAEMVELRKKNLDRLLRGLPSLKRCRVNCGTFDQERNWMCQHFFGVFAADLFWEPPPKKRGPKPKPKPRSESPKKRGRPPKLVKESSKSPQKLRRSKSTIIQMQNTKTFIYKRYFTKKVNGKKIRCWSPVKVTKPLEDPFNKVNPQDDYDLKMATKRLYGDIEVPFMFRPPKSIWHNKLLFSKNRTDRAFEGIWEQDDYVIKETRRLKRNATMKANRLAKAKAKAKSEGLPIPKNLEKSTISPELNKRKELKRPIRLRIYRGLDALNSPRRSVKSKGSTRSKRTAKSKATPRPRKLAKSKTSTRSKKTAKSKITARSKASTISKRTMNSKASAQSRRLVKSKTSTRSGKTAKSKVSTNSKIPKKSKASTKPRMSVKPKVPAKTRRSPNSNRKGRKRKTRKPKKTKKSVKSTSAKKSVKPRRVGRPRKYKKNVTGPGNAEDEVSIVNVHDPNKIVVTEEEKKKYNHSSHFLRCCYTNEVKFARELKIQLKGPRPCFFPNIPFSDINNMLSVRLRLPRVSTKDLEVDESNNEWLNNHCKTFEKLSKSVGKLYCIHIKEKHSHHDKDNELSKEVNSSDGSDFRMITCTCMIAQLEQRNVVVSPLHCFMRPKDFPAEEGETSKCLSYTCFDNKDYTAELNAQLNALKHSNKLSRETVRQLLEDSPMLTKIKIMKEVAKARKMWLKTNYKSAELLDSEFYTQIFPSLDIAFSDISPSYLEQKKIGSIKMIKPESAYWDFAMIGYQEPYKLEYSEYKKTYGCSKCVQQDSNYLVNRNKSLSLGKVKSLGSYTTVVCSGSIGGAGSPCINELGYAWGIAVNSHPDTPILDESEGEDTDEDKEHNQFNAARKIKSTPHSGKIYYEIKSDHNLRPLVQLSNSYNRNLVLSFGHSGVRHIIDECRRGIREEVHEFRQSKTSAPSFPPSATPAAPATPAIPADPDAASSSSDSLQILTGSPPSNTPLASQSKSLKRQLNLAKLSNPNHVSLRQKNKSLRK